MDCVKRRPPRRYMIGIQHGRHRSDLIQTRSAVLDTCGHGVDDRDRRRVMTFISLRRAEVRASFLIPARRRASCGHRGERLRSVQSGMGGASRPCWASDTRSRSRSSVKLWIAAGPRVIKALSGAEYRLAHPADLLFPGVDDRRALALLSAARGAYAFDMAAQLASTPSGPVFDFWRAG